MCYCYIILVTCSSLKLWLDDPSHFPELAEVFNSTSRYAKLKSVHTAVAGRLIYVRFRADTGDAMGMNMLSKVKYFMFYACLCKRKCILHFVVYQF